MVGAIGSDRCVMLLSQGLWGIFILSCKPMLPILLLLLLSQTFNPMAMPDKQQQQQQQWAQLSAANGGRMPA